MAIHLPGIFESFAGGRYFSYEPVEINDMRIRQIDLILGGGY